MYMGQRLYQEERHSRQRSLQMLRLIYLIGVTLTAAASQTAVVDL
ncbi:hypothetical protein MMON44395_20680 [Mycolicibacterium monacense DSM 44395]|nr:hypothetical protein [Mycolicibacterium monacense DSM 44395]